MSDTPQEARVETPQTTHLHQAAFFSGIIPHPAIMEQYRAIDPAYPGRIFAMAEREQAHRHAMNRDNQADATKLQKGLLLQSAAGPICALLVVTLLGGVGTWLALAGHDWVAGTVFATALVAIIPAIMGQRKAKVDESTEVDNV